MQNNVQVEKWSEVRSFENYQVSNLGRIRNRKTGNIRKLCPDTSGLLSVVLSKGKIRRTFQVHKLVALAFCHNPNNYQELKFKDCNKENVFSWNLEWCSGGQVQRELRGSKHTLVSPDGELVEMVGLRAFCREHNLPLKYMSPLCNGKIDQYKGWRLHD